MLVWSWWCDRWSCDLFGVYSSSVFWNEIKSLHCSANTNATRSSHSNIGGCNGYWTVSNYMSYDLYTFWYSCSIEALEYWQLIGSFCQLHGLAASKKFLIKCAELGKWLTMVCHAQQLHLSPDEVRWALIEICLITMTTVSISDWTSFCWIEDKGTFDVSN